jgi:3-oxoacyl-[acyl-carrier-protein] synthase II
LPDFTASQIGASSDALPAASRIAGAPAAVVVPDDREPVVELALHAAREAVTDAGFEWAGGAGQSETRVGGLSPPNSTFSPTGKSDRIRMGCVIGTSKGGLRTFSRCLKAARDGSVAETWLGFWPNAAASAVAAEFDLRGPALCPIAACATGLMSVVRGADLIREGACDVVLAGSSDASLLPIVLASYRRLGVLASGFDDPATACRPFDRSRSGFVIGEGAAVLVLEGAEHASRRGAMPYAEWIGGLMAADPHDLTQLAPEPHSLTRLIADVLRTCDVTPRDLDYINLHGTATALNDVYESLAVVTALGKDAARRIPCSSLKGGLGHLLGAAGSIELAATVLALRDGIVPPTVNLHEPDPACHLDYTPLVSRRQPLRTALKLSLGFGGHLVAGIVRKRERPGELGRLD